MNALRKDKVTAILGALTAAAGVLLVAAIVIPADPLGRSIGALLAASIAVGLGGVVVKNPAYPSSRLRHGARPRPIPLGDLPGAARPSFAAAHATTWRDEPATPDFAPIASLTEARVQRRRLAPAPREAIGA